MKNNAYQIVERLFRIYHRSLYYCAYLYVGNIEQAKNIVNQAFTILLERCDEFKEEDEMLDFLFTQTIEVCSRFGQIDGSVDIQYYRAEAMRELDKSEIVTNELTNVKPSSFITQT